MADCYCQHPMSAFYNIRRTLRESVGDDPERNPVQSDASGYENPIDPAFTEEGTELTILWGTPGTRQMKIRVRVASFPEKK